jgi:hypothetical protein
LEEAMEFLSVAEGVVRKIIGVKIEGIVIPYEGK